MTAFTSIATATVSHFNHKVTLFTSSDPPHSGDLKNVSFREVQTAGGGDTRSNPYTWTPQITKPKKKMQPPYISWTQSNLRNLHQHCYNSNFLTCHTQTKNLSLYSFSFLRSSPLLALKLSLRPTTPKTNDSTSTITTKTSTSMNMPGYYCNFLTNFLTQLSHHSLPILHIETSMWSVGHIQ